MVFRVSIKRKGELEYSWYSDCLTEIGANHTKMELEEHGYEVKIEAVEEKGW
jgi:hypothetical protein